MKQCFSISFRLDDDDEADVVVKTAKTPADQNLMGIHEACFLKAKLKVISL